MAMLQEWPEAGPRPLCLIRGTSSCSQACGDTRTNSKAGSNKPADHTLLGVLICIRSVVYGNAQCCQQQCCQHCASVLALQVAGDNSMEVLQRAMQNSHCKCTALVLTLDPSVGARCMLAALCTQAVLHGGAQQGAIRSAVLMAGSTRSAEVQRSLVRCTGVLLSHLVSLPTPPAPTHARHPPRVGAQPVCVVRACS